MTRLAGVELQLVSASWADEVPSPPHDALTPAERRAHLVAHPYSYLGVTRGAEDLAPDEHLSDAELLAESRCALGRLLDAGVFEPLRPPAFYAYGLETDGHAQLGIICGVPADGLRTGELRAHESVHGVRRDHLGRHLEVVGYQSSPVVAAYRAQPALAEVLSGAVTTDPLLDVTSADGLRQRVWALSDADSSIIAESLAAEALYIIDGHHRTGAAQSYMDLVDAEGPGAWLLAAVFPSDDMRNLSHHRVWSGDLAVLRQRLDDLGSRPVAQGSFAECRDHETLIYLDDHWVAVTLPIDHAAPPVEQLEPARLRRQVLDVVGGEVAYRHGEGTLDDLAARVAGEGKVLFAMQPITMTELFTIADEGSFMPPKSTYFSPKARSGLFVRPMHRAAPAGDQSS